jgi:APA family basic amino acid/polyamine antiporter
MRKNLSGKAEKFRASHLLRNAAKAGLTPDALLCYLLPVSATSWLHEEIQVGEQNNLVRGLTPVHAGALVVGTVIGTGIFLKAGIMSQAVGSAQWMLLAWVAAGLLSFAGALVYAEIGSLFPRAGGEYVYMREAYGDLPGFLYGWMRFWIASPGSIAAYAVGGATFLGSAGIPGINGFRTPFAVGFIMFFTGLSCLSVRFGGRVQSFVTFLKIVIITGLTLAIFAFSPTGSWSHFVPHAAGGAWPGFAAFGAAVLAALWAYDGWNNMPMVAGEIRNPQKSIPLSLIIGVGGVMLIYTLANIAYVYALPFGELLSANSKLHPDGLPAATKAASSFLGTSGTILLSSAFFISAMGALNGSILTSSRIPYAMATENMMPKFLAAVHPKTHVPVRSVLIQGGWAAVLAVSGTFDQLTDYVVFAGWVFYALASISLIVFRFRMPEAPRGYRVPAYPWLPLAFALAAVVLLANTLMTSPKESLTGLVFIASGVPVFFWMRRSRKTAATEPA